MPKPPPRLRNYPGPGDISASISASSYDLTCASQIDSRTGLRTGEEVEPFEGEPGVRNRLQHGPHLLDIDAELLRPAAHLHSRAFEFEVRVDPNRDACRQAQFRRDGLEQPHFANRLDIDQHPRRNRLAQLGLALARPGETDFLRIGAGIERQLEFARRRDIDAVDQPRHVADQRRHGVGLHA